MSKKIAVIIQARMGSTRLPGKVLKKILDKTILAHGVERVGRSRYKPEIIIATTTKESDDAIVEEAQNLGVKYYRGSEEDVLSRYYEAAVESNSEIVVRITSDCPLIDWNVLDSMLDDFFLTPSVEYLSNSLVRSFPRGLDVEIFTFDALKKAYDEAVLIEEREHVTLYIERRPEIFKMKDFVGKVNYSNLRWTLDTDADWDLIFQIFMTLYPKKRDFVLMDIINEYKAHPEWNNINDFVEQKKTEF